MKPIVDRSGRSTGEDGDARTERRTVIPAPRREGMFPGWGVRF